MAVTTGTAGVSATPATDLYNLLATAMTANGNWTQQSDSPVSITNAGSVTSGNGNIQNDSVEVRVWKCTGGAANFYLMIEINDTQNNLRFRMSEDYDTSTHKVNQPAGGGTTAPSADGTAVTPTANGTVTDTAQFIGATGSAPASSRHVAYVQVKTLGAAYNYLYEVRNNLITVATKISSTNYYCIAGCFTSLVQAIADNKPLAIFGHPTNIGVSGTAGSASVSNQGRFTRIPGFGAVSATGPFCAALMPLAAAAAGNASMTNNSNPFGSIGGSVSNPWFTNHLVFPTIVSGMSSGQPGVQRGFRGFLPDFVTGFYTTEPLVVTDTLVIGGVTYYPLGFCRDIGNTQLGHQIYVAIKG